MRSGGSHPILMVRPGTFGTHEQPIACSMTRRRPARPNLGLAALLLAAMLPLAARAESWSFQQVVEAFEQRGFTVLGSHPRCAERGLFGLYLRESRRIVVCPRGNLNDTLLHEGWHAVQSRCLRGTPFLDVDALRRGLSRRDQHDLVRLYGDGRWQREAEARVMARRDPGSYFRLVDELCGSPAAPPAAAPNETSPSGPGGEAHRLVPGNRHTPGPDRQGAQL